MAKTIKMRQEKQKTLKDALDLYFMDCRARNLREGTLKHYRDSFVQIFKFISEDTPIDEIDIDKWDEFRVMMRADPSKNDMSVYTYSRDFKTVLKYCMRQGFISPYEIPLPKADKTVIETYTDEELAALLKKPDMKRCNFTEYKCWVIVNFLLSTGVRQNSLINIQIGDVDFDNHTILIRVTKNRKPLIIPLNTDIENILRDYIQVRSQERIELEDYLFCNEFGAKMTKSSSYHALYDYNKRRGVETTGLHRFRHTFAKKWVMMGGNVVVLQKILGHSSLDITQNYLNLLASDVAREVEEISIIRQFKKDSIKMDKGRKVVQKK